MPPPVSICPKKNMPTLSQKVRVAKPQATGMIWFHNAIIAKPANAGKITKKRRRRNIVLITFFIVPEF